MYGISVVRNGVFIVLTGWSFCIPTSQAQTTRSTRLQAAVQEMNFGSYETGVEMVKTLLDEHPDFITPGQPWGVNAGDQFAWIVRNIGDVDGDGTPDFLLTSAWSHSNGFQSGRMFIVSGANQP